MTVRYNQPQRSAAAGRSRPDDIDTFLRKVQKITGRKMEIRAEVVVCHTFNDLTRSLLIQTLQLEYKGASRSVTATHDMTFEQLYKKLFGR